MKHIDIRKTLLKRKAELNQRLMALELDLQKSYSRDWAEQAQERENDEVLETLASKTAREIVSLEKVLKTLGGDKFGICQQCQQPIDTARLLALPTAVTCIHCAAKAH